MQVTPSSFSGRWLVLSTRQQKQTKSPETMIALSIQLAGRPRWAMTKSLFIASLTAGAFHTAAAQIIYSTGFEKPTFATGSPLVGQDGWIAPPPLSPNAATIAAAKKQNRGGQFVRVEGAGLVPQNFINEATGGYYDAIGSYRRSVNYDTGGTQTVRISADVLLDGKRTLHSNFFSASISAIGVEDTGASPGMGNLPFHPMVMSMATRVRISCQYF